MLDERDLLLVERARRLIWNRYRRGRHEYATVMRSRDGALFEAVNLGTLVDAVSVCGERIALGAAAVAGDTEIAVIVTVNREGAVVSPCGACREVLSDYAPELRVILPDEGGRLTAFALADLFPHKFTRYGASPKPATD